MRRALLIDLVLSFALAFFQRDGDEDGQRLVRGLMAKKSAGGRIDDHLRGVAEYLTGAEKPDVAELADRIDDEVNELVNRVPAAESSDGAGEGEPNPGDAEETDDPPSGNGEDESV